MARPSWNETYMNMCEELRKRSTCLRIQTASIIVKNNVIVSVGYNGVVSGQKHCCDYWKYVFDYHYGNLAELSLPNGLGITLDEHNSTFEKFIQSEEFYKQHHEYSNAQELHGEMNAILFAGKHGISLEGATIYTIYSPCIHCAKAIYTSGIQNVFYKELYKRDETGIHFLKERNVYVKKFEK